MLPIGPGFISPFADNGPPWKDRLPGSVPARQRPNRIDPHGLRIPGTASLATLWRHTAETVWRTAWPPPPQGPRNAVGRFRSLSAEATPLTAPTQRLRASGSASPPRHDAVLLRPRPDPLWQARAMREQDVAMAVIAARRGMTLDTYRAAVNAHIERLLRDAHLYIRVAGGVLLDFLQARRWASRLEGLANSVAPSLRTRVVRESILFGTPRADSAYGPAYGYLAGADGAPGHDHIKDWYGGVALRLSDALRGRASFMIGDSADFAGRGGFIPQPLNDLSEAYRANLYRWDPDYGAIHASAHPHLVYSPDPLDHQDLDCIMPYVEFQLHAPEDSTTPPLSFSDIVEIIVLDDRQGLYMNPRNAFRSADEADGLLRALNESGVGWRAAPGVDLSLGARARLVASRPPVGHGARQDLATWLERAAPQAVSARRSATHQLFVLPRHPGSLVKVTDPALVDPTGSRPSDERLAALREALGVYRDHRALVGRYLGPEHLAPERSFIVEDLPFDEKVWPELSAGAWPRLGPGLIRAPGLVRIQDRLPPIRAPHLHFMHRSGMQQSFPSARDLTAAWGQWLRGEGGRFDAQLFDRVERTMSSLSDLLRLSRDRHASGHPGLREAMQSLVAGVIRLVNETGWRPYLYTRALLVVREGRWTYVVQDGLHDCCAQPPRIGDATTAIARIRAREPVGPLEFGAALDEIEYALGLNAMNHALGGEGRIALPSAPLLDAQFAEALLARWQAEDWEIGWDYDVRPRGTPGVA